MALPSMALLDRDGISHLVHRLAVQKRCCVVGNSLVPLKRHPPGLSCFKLSAHLQTSFTMLDGYRFLNSFWSVFRTELHNGSSGLWSMCTGEAFLAIPVWAHALIVCIAFSLIAAIVSWALCRNRDMA